MATTFSFDVVSEFDSGEMNNVLDQTKREILSRYDFKGTAAAVDWLDGDKTGFLVQGENQYHLDAIIEMIRKKASTRGISQKVFITTAEPEESNLKLTWKVPFQQGLDGDKAKKVSKVIREAVPKVNPQIQGETVRVSGQKKDQLQAAMEAVKKAEFDFDTSFTNFR